MTVSATLVQVPGLSAEHQDALTGLLLQLAAKASRNRLRRRYYEHKTVLRDLGIAIPPQLRTVETVLGWPAKAVDSMSRRVILDGFTADVGDVDSLGLADLWAANRMESEVPQAHTSALIHATSFGFVLAGDVGAGEPEALLMARSAEWATGVWDRRRRALESALSIVSVDDFGMPDHMILYVPNLAIVMRRDENGRWDIRQSAHDLGVPVEPLPYKAGLDRPFGASRISRPVMALTDSAVRILLRTEIGAEFYNAPQRYALNVAEDAFTRTDGTAATGWEIMLGRMLVMEQNDDGTDVKVGQFQQQSMEPNVSHFRMTAQTFASETSLPLRALGVVGDNPESADAISQAEKELDLEIDYWESASLGPAWKRLVTLMLRIVDDSPAALDAYRSLRPRWRDQETSSAAAKADAFTKSASMITGLAETEVGLEMAGMNPDQIARFMAERARAQGRQTLASILAGGGVTADVVND